jgi:putative membrane protein
MKISEREPLHTRRRLHPVSILYFLIHSGKELTGLLPLIPLGIMLVRRIFGQEISVTTATFVAILAAAAGLIIFAGLRWRNFTYRVEAGVLYIEHGLWVTKKMWIAKERIQSLDTTVSLYDRVFGLVRLQVKTAGGAKDEAVLSSISAAEAERIRYALDLNGELRLNSPADQAKAAHAQAAHAQAVHAQDTGTTERKVWRMPLGRLIVAGTSSRSFGLMWLFTIGIGLKLWDDWLKETAIWLKLQPWLGVLGIPGAILLLLAITWLIAFATAFMLESGFTLVAEGDKLVIEKGFLEKKQTTIAVRRIQAVHVSENTLHRLLGLGTVRIVVAGNAEEDKTSAVLFPLIRMIELPGLLARFLPGFQLPARWNSLDGKARRNYIAVPGLIGLLLSVGVIAVFPGVWSLLTLVIPIIVFLERQLAFRQAAWAVEQEQLSIQYGRLSRHRALVLRNRIQWHRISQTPFQEGRQLATFKVAVASSRGGTRYVLRHAPEAETRRLSSWLSKRDKPIDVHSQKPDRS